MSQVCQMLQIQVLCVCTQDFVKCGGRQIPAEKTHCSGLQGIIHRKFYLLEKKPEGRLNNYTFVRTYIGFVLYFYHR